MILFNLKLAIRNLLKNKFYSILIIGGFSIGFAACILIGLYYYSEHSVNREFANFENIYRIYDAEGNNCQLDYEMFPVLATDYPEIELACPMDYHGGFEFSVIDNQEHIDTRIDNIISTNNNFFALFNEIWYVGGLAALFLTYYLSWMYYGKTTMEPIEMNK